MTPWHVYILRCADNSLYTGVTTDVQRRVEEHNNDNRLGAKYTRARRPVSLVFEQPFTSRSDACKAETAIKTLSKTEKELMIQSAQCGTE